MDTKSLVRVVVALVTAAFAGWYMGPDGEVLGVRAVALFDLIGTLFLNGLSLVVIPLVAASIITGTAKLRKEGSFRLLGTRMFVYFIGTTTLAVLIAYMVGTLLHPGVGEVSIAQVAVLPDERSAFDAISEIMTRMVPKNILSAASSGDIIGVITVSMLVGFVLPTISERASQQLFALAEGVLEIMMRVTRFVINWLPVGIFGLVAKVVAEMGTDMLAVSGKFFVVTLVALVIYMFLVLPLLLILFARVNPLAHFRAMAPACLTAFTTSSSAATIPVSMECLEQRAGVSSRITSFVVPLGASLNMCGSAIYIVIAILTIAQAYGIALTLPSTLVMLLLTILLCTGEAGIPSASLVAIVMIMQTLNLPAEGLGLVLVVDRVLDMCRTPVTVFNNSCCALMLARDLQAAEAREMA